MPRRHHLTVADDALDPELLKRVRSASQVEKPTMLRRPSSAESLTAHRVRSHSQPACVGAGVSDLLKTATVPGSPGRRGGGGGGSKRASASSAAPLSLLPPVTSRLKEYHVVVLGAGHVGKSALVHRFIHNDFSFTYQPTVEDCYSHIVQLPTGELQKVEVVDTAGLHQFPAMRQLRITAGHAFVVVYAVDSALSFHEALSLVDMVFSIKGPEISIMLVGNKADVGARGREVAEAEARAEASRRNVSFMEASALSNTNVDAVFVELLVTALNLESHGHRKSSLNDEFSRRVSLALVDSVQRQQNLRQLERLHRQASSGRKCVIL